jgi:serine/threonine protein kinase
MVIIIDTCNMTKRIGRYEVLAELGHGGFGRVFRGLDSTVGRQVAIKTLIADGDAGMLTRFRNEAAASGRLRHPNIVTIYDFGEQDNVPYIVMELLEGRDLQYAIEDPARMTLSLLAENPDHDADRRWSRARPCQRNHSPGRKAGQYNAAQ